MTETTPTVDVHLEADFFQRSLRADVQRGLSSSPKELPPKWFYDDRGSELFDEITRLPEYYPTRAEWEILRARAPAIAAFGATTFVELGSGTSTKSRTLLDAMTAQGSLRTYVPFDVSEGMLRRQVALLDTEYPSLDVHGVVGDFERHLGRWPGRGRQLVAFLGGTIGNLDAGERKEFLGDLAACLDPGDGLLLGTDLVKDVGRLEAAYDDAAGVTAEFNLNVLRVLNRELDATFDVSRFEHVARWSAADEWIEMLLRSTTDHAVRVNDLDLDVTFARGELMRTEISAKFRTERIDDELSLAGFTSRERWTDAAGDFALTLATRD